MKINWFSPLPPTQTAIGQYTENLMEFFHQKEVEVNVWTNQKEWTAHIEQYVKVHKFENPHWKIFNNSDINIYHIANNVDFHGWIWEVSQTHPGIVVLHDQHMHHFFSGYYLRYKTDKNAYESAIEKYHGGSARGIVTKFCNGSVDHEQMNAQFPMTLYAIEKAIGVVVHTEETFNTVKTSKNFPVVRVNLPYQGSTTDMIVPLETKNYKIIIFGYLGKNRRLESSLRALASFPRLQDDRSFTLDVYGVIEEEEYYLNLIKELKLQNRVQLHGFVDDDTLNAALAQSSLAINLRFPSMGEASYSQLLIWAKSLPSIVTRIGWYATLPDEVAHFVRPEHEIEDIHRHLANFLDNPTVFKEKGIKGANYLKQNHSTENYVQSIIDFIPHAIKFRSTKVGLSITNRIKPILPSANGVFLENVAQKIHRLFCDDNKSAIPVVANKLLNN